MLYQWIREAQKDDKDTMMRLIEKFNPLLKKYAAKLNYEDSYQDLLLCFIELVKGFDLNGLRNQSDGGIVSYIQTSVINYYNKKIAGLHGLKNEIIFSAMSKEQIYYVEASFPWNDRNNVFIELGAREFLSKYEGRVLYLVYQEGYSVAEVARAMGKSRQAVNQVKKRALKKLEKLCGI